MNGSKRPIVQLFNRLCSRSKFYDPYMADYDYEQVVIPDTDEDSNRLLMELMKRLKDVDVPPNIVLTVKRTRVSSSLVCSGFTLTNL